MNEAALADLARQLTTGWDQAVVLRLAIGILGAVVALLTLRAMIRRDGSFLACALWLAVGLASLSFALFPVALIHYVIRTEYGLRIRVIMGALSLLVLFVTLESIRRTQLQERYALLWIATALTLLFCVLFPHAVDLVRAATGMTYVGAIVAVAFTFLVMVSFHFSVSLSASQARHTKLAQRVAILEARLRKLEGTRGADRASDAPPPV